MKIAPLAVALCAALSSTVAVAADGISYNHVEAGYLRTDIAGDASGWAANGSWAFHPNFHAFAGYASQNVDDARRADFERWHLGVGYNRQVMSKLDFVSRLSYHMVDFDNAAPPFALPPSAPAPIVPRDADSYTIEAGVRGALGYRLEGEAMAGYGDLDVGNGEFYVRLGAQAKFSERWGIAGDVKLFGGDTQWFVGPRLSW